ncbi:MAG: FHA domain-containing protein [Bdellovibrio sp.]|nr:FHA domain-containing protein [Bdellovibrio sp.]
MANDTQNIGLMYGQSGNQKTFTVRPGRVLVGSSDRCDLVLDSSTVSGIHAVVEADLGGLKLYDMNSVGGTFVNGQKIVYATLRPGDVIKMSNIELKVFKDVKILPHNDTIDINELPILPVHTEKYHNIVFETIHPLSTLKNAEFSEYIFENETSIHPIFNWLRDKESIEVLVIFRNIILSADYFPVRGKDCVLIGNAKGTSYIEFPYLGKNEKHVLMTGGQGNITIHPLQGFKITKLSNGQHQTMRPGTTVNLASGDLVCLTLNDIQIFLQVGEHPPRVRIAPVMRGDKDLRKYFILMFCIFLLLVGMCLVVDAPVEENQLEKDPERIATILYKRPAITKAVAKTPTEEHNIVQRSVDREHTVKEQTPEVSTVAVPEVTKTVESLKTGDPKKKINKVVKKAEPNKGPKDVIKDVVTKSNENAVSKLESQAAKKEAGPAKNTVGHVDAYKFNELSSSLSGMLAKSGNFEDVSTKSNSTFSGEGSSLAASGAGATLKTAKVENGTGNVSGLTSGQLDTTKGLEGIVSKKSYFTAGLPYKTVVLGGMDPDTIRRILLEYLPQFRYCYQKVLDRSQQGYSGIVKLNFIIGASGHVTRADAGPLSGELPGEVRGCVVNVLRGIVFPEPLGGGTVEVDQPMNFYPKVR